MQAKNRFSVQTFRHTGETRYVVESIDSTEWVEVQRRGGGRLLNGW